MRPVARHLAYIADVGAPGSRAGPVKHSAPQPTSRCFASAMPVSRSAYHATSTPSPSPLPYEPAALGILSAARDYVPTHGFTQDALVRGAASVGYPPPALALLPRGAFELVMFHLISQRLSLGQHMPWLAVSQHDVGKVGGDVASRMRYALLSRLRANIAVAHHLTAAIALMSLAKNIPPSLLELGRLADEILYIAGDASVDSSWYLKRGAVAGIYASTEMFMTQDQSTDFVDTEKFLDRRLEDARVIGQSTVDVGQFLGFAGISTINILRSWNVRI